MREKHYLVIAVCVFLFVLFVISFWLPDQRDKASISRLESIRKEFDKQGRLIFHPVHRNSDVRPHDQNMNEDIHLSRDKVALKEKIENDKVVKNSVNSAESNDVPLFGRRGTGEGSPVTKEETQGGEPTDSDTKQKRDVVRKMMKHAWDGYARFAWGFNEVRPVTQTAHTGSVFGGGNLGATIIDGMDTLYIMGLNEEFEKGREWIENTFHFSTGDVSVFETNIRFVGGLLTLYALTNNEKFLSKAKDVADSLLPAFNTDTGLPLGLINTRSGSTHNYGWASGGCSILSEFGTLHMEFAALSEFTGIPVYKQKVEKIRDILAKVDKPEGLYFNYLNPHSLSWGQHHASLAGLGDSFYEYLLKEWLRSGKQDTQARNMYNDAMVAIEPKMLRRSKQSNLLYIGDYLYSRTQSKMDHLACFAGGMFALGANTSSIQDTKWFNYGREITHTCHESYSRAASHLGPESFHFTGGVEAMSTSGRDSVYILRPETAESYFYLWRLTKDEKYRAWAWEMVQALEKHSKSPGGYSGLVNVNSNDPPKDDVQQSFFLAETLKYLYLIFSEDTLLPLNRWVFNTEAHPLPIRGAVKIPKAQSSSDRVL